MMILSGSITASVTSRTSSSEAIEMCVGRVSIGSSVPVPVLKRLATVDGHVVYGPAGVAIMTIDGGVNPGASANGVIGTRVGSTCQGRSPATLKRYRPNPHQFALSSRYRTALFLHAVRLITATISGWLGDVKTDRVDARRCCPKIEGHQE